jgi:hypothetical protein
VALPQWDPIPRSRAERLCAGARRALRVLGIAFGVAVIAGILLSGSPNAPEAMKRHLPWRGQIEVQYAPEFADRRWPDGEVPYANEVPEQAEALALAVRAWNESGADVHFYPVPRDEAKLVIRRIDGGDCSLADALLGHVPGSRVRIFRIDPSTPGCDRYNGARAARSRTSSASCSGWSTKSTRARP